MIHALALRAVAAWMGQRGDRYRRDIMMICRTDQGDGNAIVDNGMVVEVVIIDDRTLVINLRHMLMRDTEIARMRIAEMIGGHEGEATGGQSEVKANRNIGTAIGEADARLVGGERRQRGPATIIAARTPSHP